MGIFDLFKKSSANRRQYLRLKSYCLIKYAKLQDNNSEIGKTANIKNISEGGLLFTVYDPLPVSSVIKLAINLPEHPNGIEVYAKVIRCTKVSENESIYHVAVNFVDLSENIRGLIVKHIDSAVNDDHGKKLIEKSSPWKLWRRKKMKILPGSGGAFFTEKKQ